MLVVTAVAAAVDFNALAATQDFQPLASVAGHTNGHADESSVATAS